MTKSDSDRGNNRRGAGRPYVPTALKKAGLYLKLPPWLVQWLRSKEAKAIGSQAALIENALRETYKLSPQKNPLTPDPATPPPPKKAKR